MNKINKIIAIFASLAVSLSALALTTYADDIESAIETETAIESTSEYESDYETERPSP